MKKILICCAAVAAFAGMSLASSEYDRLLAELEELDIAADQAWDNVKTPADYAVRKKDLRQKLLGSIGGLFERCPLNADKRGTVQRDGYCVEKVMFESLPNVHVTALVFVPDAARFKPPYPAVAVSCGHAVEGKACGGYQRACVMGAKEGFLMLIYDPFGQGERMMSPEPNMVAHNRLGAAAFRLGRSAAAFRIWDGVRVLDYLQSRPDVRPDRLGFMGNSGGGTMTALIMALEPRLKAAAPACYISSIREVVKAIGPQDAEQCIFGQLNDGINHASLVLMADAAVRLQFSQHDFFPIKGARSTYEVVRRTADRLGIGGRFSATTVPGEHGWKESSRRSSLDWMRQWLMDEEPNGRTDDDYAALDKTFDPETADMGLARREANVTDAGGVRWIDGERTFYDCLVDELIGENTARLVFRDTEAPRHRYYNTLGYAAEQNAAIAHMLGRSLVADRRDAILEAARRHAAEGGPKPVLVGLDTWEQPAAQAYAAHPELFSGFKSLGDGLFYRAERRAASSPRGLHAQSYDVAWEGRALPLEDARISSVPFCRVWPGHQREMAQTEMSHFVRFDWTAAGTFSVKGEGVGKALKGLLPMSARNIAKSVDSDALTLSISRPGAYILEFEGLPTLHVFADPPLAPIPAPGPGGRLMRFAKGEHHPGVVAPKSGDVVVLDEGAVVYGSLFVLNATNVTVTGRGIFDGSKLERADETMKAFRRANGLPEIDTESACFAYSVYGSENVTISGVTFRDPPFWTLVIRNQCRKTLVDNIHIVGNWRYNSDGIDVCASADTEIRNSFIRTFDDCVIARGPYMKGEFAPVSGMTVTNCDLWADWGVVFKAQVQDFHGSTIEDVLVKDCRFLSLQDTGVFLAVRYGCDLDIIRRMTFEDLEYDFRPQARSKIQAKDGESFVAEPLDANYLLYACSYTLGKNLGNQRNAPMEDPDYYHFIFEDIALRRVKAYGEKRNLIAYLKAEVPRHEIRRVIIEDVPAHRLVRSPNVDVDDPMAHAVRVGSGEE